MPDLDLTLVNAALSRTGTAAPISQLGDGSKAAEIVATNYDKLVRAQLAAYPWKFASKIAELNRLDPDVAGDPPEPWSAAYQLPTDLLDLRTVMVGGSPIYYAVHGSKILCDAAESDAVIAHYLWRVTESAMPEWFAEFIIVKLEAMFLRGIGERYDQATERDQAAMVQWSIAKNRDAQSQSPRDPFVSPTLQARAGTMVMTPGQFPWR